MVQHCLGFQCGLVYLFQVEKVVEKDLLPSLNPSVADVEALRVYLILPELLRVLKKQGRETGLTALYASAVVNLDPCMSLVLGKSDHK